MRMLSQLESLKVRMMAEAEADKVGIRITTTYFFPRVSCFVVIAGVVTQQSP
jgi:hypothetical protein